ncbi:ras GTPase-activating protein-binding protein 2 isoform X2 [Sesamum indicum]|uniref:Ras GTPase-activating protein-binding protein 2 isoform X2 n=1 Tax=Sesamum indicum TaxID=4182 RepID=A0A8M8V208_SESIN|nr:ras GTPase-activating protein-binding protein 2 isoform X2 [Sesamum indicum]
MANQHAAPVTAAQVGSYFVQQYYQVFQQQRDYVHQFYTDSSSMIRVDGEISASASDMVKIHQLIMSLDFTGIEIKTINALESWSGGVLVVVSGSVKSIDFSGGRKFVQTFFLAPQEKGYFVLNDMFHFADEEVPHQSSVAQEQNVDCQPTISSHLPDPPADYPLEEAARNYVNSFHIDGGDPVQEYSYQESEPENETDQLDPEPEIEPVPEAVVGRLTEETPIEESSPFPQSAVTTPQGPQPSAQEPIAEPGKLTYASILRAKGKPPSSFISPPAITRTAPPAADRNHISQPSRQQSAPTSPNSRGYAGEGALPLKEGDLKSVYVRNLPSTVTSLDVLQEFKSFGNINSDGVFLRNRVDTGICFAFIEFEDVLSAQSAIKASPIQFAGRRVYIEQRKPNPVASRGGRSGGRGSGGRGGRSSGRGSDRNGIRSNSLRGT